MNLKINKIHIPTICAVLLTIASLVGSLIYFRSNANKIVKETTQYFLEMNANSQAAMFKIKLESQVDILKAAAEFLSKSYDSFDVEGIEENIDTLLKNTNKVGSFTHLLFANKDGVIFENRKRKDVSRARWFLEAISGKTYISNIQSNSVSGDFLFIAIPILKSGKIEGVLYGSFQASILSSLIEAAEFQEDYTSILLSDDGSILARSASTSLFTNRITNFYDIGTSWGLDGKMTLSDVKLQILEGKSTTIPYMTGSMPRLAIISPVKLNGWIYAIVISQDIITNQSKVLQGYLIIVMTVISSAFILLLFAVFYLIQHNAIMENTVDRYRMVTKQAQASVFDYDFAKEKLILTGDAKDRFENSNEKFNEKKILEMLENIIHSDDKDTIEEIKNLKTNKKTQILRELRIKSAEGKYNWHRITGTVVRDAAGNALRFVGNVVNVEDEINREQMLKRKAEIDQLSGLLNKGAFTQHVSELLAQSSESNLYAFYIIDLDNFKKVNDTLGHIVGDRVISEVAQKLCLVFSEQDLVGRIGGDEFAVFLRLHDEGKQLGLKIIEAKAGAACQIINKIYSDGTNNVNITASIGVSIFPRNGTTFNELYTSADSVLYLSKNGGKNQYNITKDINSKEEK